jgi:alkylated DNA repair protein (DNA oxidative demethylase)
MVLRGFALPHAQALVDDTGMIAMAAPFRHMKTPGGLTMSVAMTNCGPLGWVTDSHGYRYATHDPVTGALWPEMPDSWRALASQAAARAGFAGFDPDACLINRYVPGARMALHQDRDERDMQQPIVSVSLGLPVMFQFGGMQRSHPARRVPLLHGDVVVWGGAARLRYHGVLTLKTGEHSLTGETRINLTFRKAA